VCQVEGIAQGYGMGILIVRKELIDKIIIECLARIKSQGFLVCGEGGMRQIALSNHPQVYSEVTTYGGARLIKEYKFFLNPKITLDKCA